MVWRAEDPQGNESAKIKWELVPYTRGSVLDLGAGMWKAFPHFTSVDNGDHAKFGHQISPDLRVDTCAKLERLASGSWDAVFSSHLLEHIPYGEVPAALAEWLRVIKPSGYLILYVPDEDEYPKVGEPHANPEHKWNVNYQRVVDAMPESGWDLVDFQKRNQDQEYSLFFVFQKRKGKPAFSYRNEKPTKTAAVVRYGAFGDLLQASSIFAGLKKQGFHVTLYTSPPGSEVITNDPNIDRIILQDKDQVPNHELGQFWEAIAKKYERFINLSESVEGTLLALPGRMNHSWPKEIRHKRLNENYLEFQHELAGVPHDPQVKFYPTLDEKAWARQQRERMGEFVVLWSLAGSSVHKTWPHLDAIIARLMVAYEHVEVVLVGGPDCVILEQGWEKEKRVHLRSGKWSIRQSLAFAQLADIVVGPETGVLNSVACLDMPKVIFLSHSTEKNLTRDWVNTTSLHSTPDCYPCHILHYGWKHCHRDDATGTAICQVQITPEMAWNAIASRIPDRLLKVA